MTDFDLFTLMCEQQGAHTCIIELFWNVVGHGLDGSKK